MAAGTKLALTFKKGDGKNVNFSYKYADPECSSSDAKALMQGMIANGSIFEKVPTAIVSAKLVTTSETTLNVTE